MSACTLIRPSYRRESSHMVSGKSYFRAAVTVNSESWRHVTWQSRERNEVSGRASATQLIALRPDGT